MHETCRSTEGKTQLPEGEIDIGCNRIQTAHLKKYPSHRCLIISSCTAWYSNTHSQQAKMSTVPRISPLVDATLQFMVELARSSRQITEERTPTKRLVMTMIPLFGRFKAWTKDFEQETPVQTPAASVEGLDSVGTS